MRLVDAEAKGLLMELSTYSRYTGIDEAPIETAVDAIHQAPTIDAVPVVRCKDCVSFHYSGMGGDNGITYCAKGIEMQPTDFCSYGERKDNG